MRMAATAAADAETLGHPYPTPACMHAGPHLIDLDVCGCGGLQVLDGGACLADQLSNQVLGHRDDLRYAAILVGGGAQAFLDWRWA